MTKKEILQVLQAGLSVAGMTAGGDLIIASPIWQSSKIEMRENTQRTGIAIFDSPADFVSCLDLLDDVWLHTAHTVEAIE